ncbi:hypothetical protein [Paenibacillus sp. FSL H7-0331]|uniref:hypothetical protein n=1 Tax=Paenibacillus sp. FSL H7-0331 TaxID=1920421 RepID=UPI00096E51E5|nr:hypothetical protein [Paenibacillus sp. FSL H7-0331]OMF02626.1 hypothetical protein BK127_37090 [Paenibacillus sp. FSL H7-0331]
MTENKDEKDIIQIPQYHSPLRHLMNEAYELEHKFIKTLEEAKEVQNSYLVMEGDHGGQIYIVCPVHIIRADKDTLIRLLKDIDKVEWDESDSTGMYFERFNQGDIVSGGMGGGLATEKLWVHDSLIRIGNEISKVIYGKKKRINLK